MDADVARDTGVCWPFFLPDKNQQWRLTDIYDGLDNTLLIAENINAGSSGLFSDPEPRNCGFIYPVDRATALGQYFPNPNNPAGNSGRPNAEKHPGEGTPSPSSNHPDFVNVAMVGGSARSLSDSIDGTVYAQLVTPRGSIPRTIRGRTCTKVVTGQSFRPQPAFSQNAF